MEIIIKKTKSNKTIHAKNDEPNIIEKSIYIKLIFFSLIIKTNINETIPKILFLKIIGNNIVISIKRNVIFLVL